METVRYYVSPERLEKYKPYFPTLYPELCRAAEIIRSSETALAFLSRLIGAVHGTEEVTIKNTEGDTVSNFAPVFALLAHIEDCEAELEKRDFSSSVRESILQKHENILKEHKRKFGYYACSQILFDWSKHYLKPDIFSMDTLEFEIQEYGNDDIFTGPNGQLIPLRNAVLENGVYKGVTVQRGGADGIAAELPAAQYTPVLQQGDTVISVHIPAKADISPKNCEIAFQHALDFFEKHYPECKIKALVCHSWLMDPQLAEGLRPDSAILSFQRFYTVTPTVSSGEEVMYFVFNKRPEDLSTLPEDTTLTRFLKARYLQNNPIYAYLGIHLIGR